MKMNLSKEMMMLGKKSSVIREIFEYSKKRKAEIGADKVFDFSIGNPSVPAPKEIGETIAKLAREMDPVLLHGYTAAVGDPGARAKIAEGIHRDFHTPNRPDLVYMTCGAAASLTISLNAILQPGEEVLVPTPYFPEYKVFTEHADGVLVEIPCDKDFQLDLNAIENAITAKTRAIIINSPNNPTGAIFRTEDLKKLSALLQQKEKEYDRTIYIIADEPYRKLVWNGEEVPFLPELYPDTLVCYSYSKALSLPGERIGYIFVSPYMEACGDVFAAVCGAGRALGFVCAPSLMQFMIAECADCTADFRIYRKNRERLMEMLTDIGYEVIPPDGAFYLFVKALEPDAHAFYEKGKKHELLLVPSDSFGCTGYVRIAYCVTPEQIEAAKPAFEALYRDYQEGND